MGPFPTPQCLHHIFTTLIFFHLMVFFVLSEYRNIIVWHARRKVMNPQKALHRLMYSSLDARAYSKQLDILEQHFLSLQNEGNCYPCFMLRAELKVIGNILFIIFYRNNRTRLNSHSAHPFFFSYIFFHSLFVLAWHGFHHCHKIKAGGMSHPHFLCV